MNDVKRLNVILPIIRVSCVPSRDFAQEIIRAAKSITECSHGVANADTIWFSTNMYQWSSKIYLVHNTVKQHIEGKLKIKITERADLPKDLAVVFDSTRVTGDDFESGQWLTPSGTLLEPFAARVMKFF